MDRDEPFFVYYPMMLPHWPFVPTPDHPDWDPAMWRDATNEPGGYRSQKYWDAFVRYTDKMVGQLVATLEETGQRDNTLIIWTGDNGTYTDIVSEFRGKPYRGGKGSTKDNGTHVGFIASWPGVIQPGQLSDALVDFSDVLPTLTEAAAAVTPGNVDGVSLVPVFKGRPGAEREAAEVREELSLPVRASSCLTSARWSSCATRRPAAADRPRATEVSSSKRLRATVDLAGGRWFDDFAV